MLVTDGQRCLLAHEHRFGEKMYSTLAGFIAPMLLDGPMDGEVFRAWCEQMLAPASHRIASLPIRANEREEGGQQKGVGPEKEHVGGRGERARHLEQQLVHAEDALARQEGADPQRQQRPGETGGVAPLQPSRGQGVGVLGAGARVDHRLGAAVGRAVEDLDLLAVEDPATSSPGLAFLLATIASFGEREAFTFWRTSSA